MEAESNTLPGGLAVFVVHALANRSVKYLPPIVRHGCAVLRKGNVVSCVHHVASIISSKLCGQRQLKNYRPITLRFAYPRIPRLFAVAGF